MQISRTLKSMALRAIALAFMGTMALAQSVDPVVDLNALLQAGDREAAIAAIRKGADVNRRQADGSTPLQWAVYKVDVELTRELLARGADPDARNNLGATAMGEAAKLANLELVQMLLKAKAKVDLANDEGQTPLMLAARTGNLPVAEALIKAGANVNAAESWRGQTVLMWAAGSRGAELVSLLIKRGAKVDTRAFVSDWGSQITSEPRAQYRPTAGLTAMFYAIRSGCRDCVQALLKGGADINKPNPDGITPLMAAIDNLQFDIANDLLDAKANPHLVDWWGRTALYNAVDMRSFSNRFLIGAGNLPATGAAPPQQAAALQLAKRLLEMGVEVNTQLNFHRPGRGGNSGRFTDDSLTTGTSPLLRAAISFDREVIELLLRHGALVDLPNVMGVTPLMIASGIGVSPRDTRGTYGSDAQDRALEVLPVLLKAGANINARVTDTSGHSAIIARPSSMTTRQGQTAIFGAVNWGWNRVVEYLLTNGARVDIKDDAGKTLLDAIAGKAGGRDFKANEEIAASIKKAIGAS